MKMFKTLALAMAGMASIGLGSLAMAGNTCTVDLKAATPVCSGVPGVTTYSAFASATLNSAYKMGTLQVDLQIYPGKTAVFEFYYDIAPVGWNFNIADSATCDGWGGDYGTQSWDAESHMNGTDFSVYTNSTANYAMVDNISSAVSAGQKFVVVVSDGHIDWRNSTTGAWDTLTLTGALYSLGGEYDYEGAINYKLYVGLNRTAGSYNRNGYGLSSVKITLY